MDDLGEINSREIQAFYYQIVNNSVATQQTWLSILTEQERQVVLNNPRLSDALRNRELSVISLYCQLRDCSINTAIIEIARDLELTSVINYRRLQHEIAEPPTPVALHVEHPSWDKEKGELLWGDEVIRKVKYLNKAVNMVRILDSFQAQKWPARIANPLTTNKDPQQLNDSIRTLNQDLQKIRFSADGTGEGVRWSLRQPH